MNFTKYQGAGNDFIMILRSEWPDFDEKLTPEMCDRRMGIGADGVIVIEPCQKADFEVNYLNADGSKSFCGNGARCSVVFAHEKGVFEGRSAQFLAIDGMHTGEIVEDGRVQVSMNDVDSVQKIEGNAFVCDTGSPHYVYLDVDLSKVDVISEGRKIRYSEPYKAEGINVNWVAKNNDGSFDILTYERGVEGETFACGTGATAAAIILGDQREVTSPVVLHAKGGTLRVFFKKFQNRYINIYLEGPAKRVFSGVWD